MKLSAKINLDSVLNIILLNYFEFCLDWIGRKPPIKSKIFDLKKAFDTISYEILLKKFKYYGFSYKVVKLMQSYL